MVIESFMYMIFFL